MPYHAPSDMGFFKNVRKSSPDAFAAYAQFDEAALRNPDKVIPRKYTELMSIAVALATQCVYCIDAHVAAAKKEGATETALSETVINATALRAGASMAHGLMAMKMYEEGPRTGMAHNH